MTDHLANELLTDYAHGELSPADDARVHAHLAACAECRRAYEAEVALSEALRAAATAEEREFPSLVKAKVWEQVRAARPGPLARLSALWRPVYALPVAAALAVFVYFQSPLAHADRSTIAATYYLEEHAAQAVQNPLTERSSASPPIETSALEGSGAQVTLAEEEQPQGVAPILAFDASQH